MSLTRRIITRAWYRPRAPVPYRTLAAAGDALRHVLSRYVHARARARGIPRHTRSPITLSIDVRVLGDVFYRVLYSPADTAPSSRNNPRPSFFSPPLNPEVYIWRLFIPRDRSAPPPLLSDPTPLRILPRFYTVGL